MPRLFVGLSLPPQAVEALGRLQSGLAGARWRPPENFHLTLRFIGETAEPVAHDLAAALGGVDAPAFRLQLEGCGQFGDKRPRAVWAGVRSEPALNHLQAKIEASLQRAGLAPEGRKFTPHVTLAYLKHVRPEKVAAFIAACGLFQTPDFQVEAFHLYSSALGNEASVYRIEESYPLRALT